MRILIMVLNVEKWEEKKKLTRGVKLSRTMKQNEKLKRCKELTQVLFLIYSLFYYKNIKPNE